MKKKFLNVHASEDSTTAISTLSSFADQKDDWPGRLDYIRRSKMTGCYTTPTKKHNDQTADHHIIGPSLSYTVESLAFVAKY